MADNTVEIIIKAAVDKAGEKVRSFTQKATQQFKRMGDFVRNIGKKLFNLKSIAIGALAGWGISRVVGEFERLSGVQEQVEATLKQAMVSMGRYSQGAFEATKEHAAALQKVTTFGDEATLAGAKFLTTYKEISDDLVPHATKVMLDLAALMGGDTVQAANMLGKASMGLGGELRRVGITIDEDVAKAGDFAAILQEIEKQVGGQAEALATTDAGKIQQFGNVWSDIKEKIGSAIAKIHAAVAERLKPLLESADEWLGDFLESGQWEEWANSISAWISEKVVSAVEWMWKTLKKGYAWFQENWPALRKTWENWTAYLQKVTIPVLKNVFKIIGWVADKILWVTSRLDEFWKLMTDPKETEIAFYGIGSTKKLLSEKIDEMTERMSDFHDHAAETIASVTNMTAPSQGITQAAGGVRTSMGLPTISAEVARQLFFIERIRRHEAPGPAQIGSFKPIINMSFAFPPTKEQAKQAARQISGALAEEIKYGRGELASALKAMGW